MALGYYKNHYNSHALPLYILIVHITRIWACLLFPYIVAVLDTANAALATDEAVLQEKIGAGIFKDVPIPGTTVAQQ